MRTFGLGLAVAAALGLSGVAAEAGAVLDKIMADKVMTMATDANLIPLSFINQQNEMDGFDVDVGKEIAKRLGVELKIVNPEWTVITAGKWAGRWDVSIGSMTPTKERANVLDFPAVYYYTPASYVVHNDSAVQAVADLNGKNIGAPAGTTYEAYLRHALTIDAEGTPPFTYDVTPGKITTLPASTALMDDLRLGDGKRLDAILYAQPNLQEAIKNGYPFRLIGEPAFYEPLAIAIDKGDKELNDKLAEVVKSMQDDGTMTTLSQKWFGTDYSKTMK